MENDKAPNNKVIVGAESNRQLSLPSEIINRGLDLVARVEYQRDIKKFQQPIHYFPGIHAPSCVDFSRNGRFAAITSYAGFNGADPDLIIWDVIEGSTKVLSLKERGYNFGAYLFSVALSSSGNLAVMGYDDGGTLCWDIENNILRDFRGKTSNLYRMAAICLVFSPNEQWFATNIGDFTFLFDIGSGERLDHLVFPRSDAQYYNQMVFSNDGSKLLVGSGQFFDYMKLLDVRGEREPVYIRNAIDSRAVAIFPDQQKLLSVNGNGVITVWDGISSDEISCWSHSKTLSQVSDICSEDQLPQLTPKTGDFRKEILLSCPFRSVDISTDGQRIMSGGGDKYMRLWTLDGKEICEYPHNTQVVKVAFMPDGKHAISGCWDGSVYLWDLPE